MQWNNYEAGGAQGHTRGAGEATALPAEPCRTHGGAAGDAAVCRCLSHRAGSFRGALLGPPERSPLGFGVNPAPSQPILPLGCEVSSWETPADPRGAPGPRACGGDTGSSS